MSFKFKVDGDDTDAILSAYTLTIYEQEFGGADLIKDIFGKVEVTNRDVRDVLSDENDKHPVNDSDASDDGVFVVIDYEKTNWTALMRCAWACLKAFDDSVHPFMEWSKESHELDLNEVAGTVFPEATRMFFRAGVAASA